MLRRLAFPVVAIVAALILTSSPAQAATSTASSSAVPVAASLANLDLVASNPSFVGAGASTYNETGLSVVGQYLVISGDTLSGIAARFCGRASAYPSLAAASGIRNPDLIFPGQRISLACSGASTASSPAPAAPASSKADAVVAFALAQVGKAYVWGAAGPGAFDCSGLVVAAYARVGVYLPHQSEAQMGYGRYVARADLRPGDVIQPFFGHVVIYIGGGRIVEAATPQQGVRTNTLYAYHTARRYV